MLSICGSPALYELCAKHEISDYVKYDLEMQVEHLRIFKNVILPITQTATQRAKAFTQIEALLAKLRSAIEELSFEDRSALDNEYFGIDEPGFEDVYEVVGNPLAFDVAGHLIPAIEASVRGVRGRLQGVGKSGQPPITEKQADCIRCIAQTLKRADIAPSYSGVFIEFCTAMFKDAGLTVPDRAIRHFMEKLRPALKVAGYCL